MEHAHQDEFEKELKHLEEEIRHENAEIEHEVKEIQHQKEDVEYLEKELKEFERKHEHDCDEKCVIIVNTRPKEYDHKEISFEQVVELAFPNVQSDEKKGYSVSYIKGIDSKPTGELTPGQSVKVKCKMEFDVTPTNQS